MTTYTVRVNHEAGQLWATVDEQPGLFATGDNLAELFTTLGAALEGSAENRICDRQYAPALTTAGAVMDRELEAAQDLMTDIDTRDGHWVVYPETPDEVESRLREMAEHLRRAEDVARSFGCGATTRGSQ